MKRSKIVKRQQSQVDSNASETFISVQETSEGKNNASEAYDASPETLEEKKALENKSPPVNTNDSKAHDSAQDTSEWRKVLENQHAGEHPKRKPRMSWLPIISILH